MVLTFREILRRAGARLSNTSTSTTETNDLYPKLKDWCQERYERVYDSYPWKNCLASTTKQLTASTATYALDRDIGRIWAVYDQTNGVIIKPTNVQSHIRFNATDLDQTGNVATGDPKRYYDIGTLTVKAQLTDTGGETVSVISSKSTDLTPNVVHIVGLSGGVELYEDITLTGDTIANGSIVWDINQYLRVSVGTSDASRKSVTGVITVTGTTSLDVFAQISPYEIAPQYKWIKVSPTPKSSGTQPTWLFWYNKRLQMFISDNDIPIIDVGAALVEGIVSDGLREDGQVSEAQVEEQMFINMVNEKQSADGGYDEIEQFVPEDTQLIQALDYGRVVGGAE